MKSKERYVVVTTTSTHRIRYAVPLSELQSLNTDQPVDSAWAMDLVVCGDIEEFSQEWIGEQIVDRTVLDEDQIIELFDRDNAYLKNWTRDQKITRIFNWQRSPDK
jgi:glycerol-3-phosphate cytidylyltransferase-like family protein